jgi:transketolase
MHDLFYHVLTERDRFIFSKASGSATYYIILADKGYFPKEKLAEYLHDYPEASKEVPGVLHSVGSVGHGLAVAVGLALADRTRKVYCLVSDGELQEGVTWESLLFARQHHLSNLIVIVDRNGIQACGPTEDIMSLEPLKAKFRAFDWCATSLDGHDSKQLLWALKKPNLHGPYAIIAETVKGKGVDFMENDYRWHYKNLDDELLEQALCQI